MKANKKSNAGRKKFGARKQTSVKKSLDENLDLAAIGQFAESKESRDLFRIAAHWKKYYSPLFSDFLKDNDLVFAVVPKKRKNLEQYLNSLSESGSDLRTSIGQPANIQRSVALRILLRTLDDALSNSDTQPLDTLVKAVRAVKDINDSGPRSQLDYRVLTVALEQGLLNEKMKSKPKITRREFQTLLEFECDPRHLRRICDKFGLEFKLGKPGRPKK